MQSQSKIADHGCHYSYCAKKYLIMLLALQLYFLRVSYKCVFVCMYACIHPFVRWCSGPGLQHVCVCACMRTFTQLFGGARFPFASTCPSVCECVCVCALTQFGGAQVPFSSRCPVCMCVCTRKICALTQLFGGARVPLFSTCPGCHT